MALVQLSKNTNIKSVMQNTRLTPLQINLVWVLYTEQRNMEIIELIGHVRKQNAENYKFVQDRAFYTAVSVLCVKGIIRYG